MKDTLFILLLCFLVCFALSIFMIKKYLWQRNLSPKWQIITGFGAPWNELGAYINSTKKDNGSVGIWFKLMIISFAAMMLTSAILAFL